VYCTLSMMASHIQNLSQFLQSFGVAALALLFVPALIAALARNVALALAASLLSLTSLMLFIAPASATSGLAIVSGLGSILVALESVVARRRMMAFNKQVADLTSRVNELEGAEARRYMLELSGEGTRDPPRAQNGGLGLTIQKQEGIQKEPRLLATRARPSVQPTRKVRPTKLARAISNCFNHF
jgi:hypothetical protein